MGLFPHFSKDYAGEINEHGTLNCALFERHRHSNIDVYAVH
jgi:hypothetical protein